MKELSIDQALREGTAVQEMAKQEAQSRGSKLEPTGEIYEFGYYLVKLLLEFDKNIGEESIDSLNRLRAIELAIGDEDAKSITDAFTKFSTINKSVLRNLQDKENVDERFKIPLDMFKQTPIWSIIVARHQNIEPQLSTYFTGCIKLFDVFMRKAN